jgi:hypothetical protein
MNEQNRHQSIDITPSPRVLRMLGEIAFAPWQCLAELIDNGIDAFLDAGYAGGGPSAPIITISLPTVSELNNGTGVLQVQDNGAGMTIDQLQNAVRAGYSGNNSVDKLGLFGVGFNISTARLSSRTEVWTSTADSPNWVSVTIDFDELEKVARETSDHSRLYRSPVEIREKSVPELESGAHGTWVRLTKLKKDLVYPLITGRSKATTRFKLGKIYGKVMRDHNFTLMYGADVIKPWKHCVWSSTRSVENRVFTNIPAIKEINEVLPDKRYCHTCWVWLQDNEAACPSCGFDSEVGIRSRAIRGWIGIQRYFDLKHYGIDLIRNGRVIEELDKSFFYWKNPATEENELEYPVDTQFWGGRIVGELEIDFVRVSHQKDGFEKLSPEWGIVVEKIRGAAPMRPDIAQNRAGMQRNRSPLAILFAGYRGSKPAGLRNLVPGDADNGSGINAALRDMVHKFDQGIEEYQDDTLRSKSGFLES